MTYPITIMERHTLEVIHDLEKEFKYAPTQQEVADEMGISQALVSRRIRALKEKGYIKSLNQFKRSITLAKLGVEYFIAKGE